MQFLNGILRNIGNMMGFPSKWNMGSFVSLSFICQCLLYSAICRSPGALSKYRDGYRSIAVSSAKDG